jgi:NADPH:quinone reductase
MLGIAMRTTANIAAIHERSLTVSGVFMVLPLLSGVGIDHFGEILTTLGRWYGDGRFAPVVHPAEFRLEEIADAHQLLEAGSISGKIVVNVP